MTQAIKTQGCKLKRGNGDVSEVFTTIGEVTDWTGPTQTAKQVDVTSLDSTAREYISGLRDAGDVTFNVNYVPGDATQQGLQSDITNGTTRNFELHLTDDDTTPTKIAFAAIVTSFGIKGSADDAVKASISLKVSGSPVYTYAA